VDVKTNDTVVVIGGGPAGIAVAATLKSLGVRTRILERADSVGARWRGHYDRLHLHTTRRGSGLPGLAIPSSYGRWVSRDDFVRYQEAYVRHHGLELELGTSVERVDRAGDGWNVKTSKGDIAGRFVVVAAGFNNAATTPSWPGFDGFGGELVHSKDYKTGAKYKAKRVVVVGTGNTGAEIATDLVEQGASEIWWAYRTPPTILPRAFAGVATQSLGILLRPLPAGVVDPIASVFGRLTVGNLRKFGLPPAQRGMYTAVLRDQVLPVLDVGLVGAIKQGRVKPVPTIERFEANDVVLIDGQRITADAIVVCTGFRPALEPIVGHLGVLDNHGIPSVHGAEQHANAPGLFFLGYTNAISGLLREIAHHAGKVARVIHTARKAAPQELLSPA
jgi:putative flavoprotein involved in K+ transport